MKIKRVSTSSYIMVSLVFALTAGAGFGYGLKTFYAFVTLAILLSLRSRLAHGLFVVTIALLSAAYYPVALNYGRPNINVMLAVNYTDPGETAEFISSTPLQDWILSLAVLVAAFAVMVMRRRTTFRLSRTVALFAVSACLVSPVYHWFESPRAAWSAIHYPPARFAIEAYTSYNQVKNDRELYQIHTAERTTWAPVAAAGGPETIVIVIGESARRDFHGAYGFELDNTPFMSSAPGKLFTDYVSAGPSTVMSLIHSLYGIDKEGARLVRGNYLEKSIIQYNNSVVRLLGAAGYRTEWISNQRFFGINDSPIALAGQQANEYFFAKRGEPGDEKKLDTVLLPRIALALAREGRKAVFIHLNGSHPMACERTGGHYDQFYRNHEVSCYVQSIRNTDAILQQISRQLKARGQSWALMYFSDHGLRTVARDEDAERFTHSDKFREDYDVPLFVATSDDTTHQLVSAKRSGFELVAMIAQLAHITDPAIDTHCDLLSDVTCNDSRRVLNADGFPVLYDYLESEKIVSK